MGQGTACPNSLPQAATDLSLLVTHTNLWFRRPTLYPIELRAHIKFRPQIVCNSIYPTVRFDTCLLYHFFRICQLKLNPSSVFVKIFFEVPDL